jgi:AraC-like DNA-binding protein
MENSSFVLHECMTPEMERVLKHINQVNEFNRLSALLYQTKAQELIYFLFSKLLTRPAGTSLAIDQADAKKIYEIRETILADLALTPQLPQLAKLAGMSLTKMKLLFRQVFGDSIYNYYQAAKMNEAANLLKDLSVSETGYKLGFTNLSHFARLFNKHYEIKPKRFKDSLKPA